MSPRELWIAALRSGEYKQGRDILCEAGNYCCLGVACEVYQKHVGDLVIEDLLHCKRYDGETHSLPVKVIKWLGLINNRGSCKHNNITLTLLNDTEMYDFEQIAEILEKNNDYFVT